MVQETNWCHCAMSLNLIDEFTLNIFDLEGTLNNTNANRIAFYTNL